MIDRAGSGSGPQVVVVGCGAIGLPLAVALASRGRRVLGYDIDAGKIEALGQGRLALMDEGLEPALRGALDAGGLRFASSLETTPAARIFVLAVPTPACAERGFDAGPLEAAAKAVDAVALDGDLVCIRSTVPIGATRALAEAHPRLAFVACPDRTVSGRAFLEQFETPHLVGGGVEAAVDLAEALFACLGAVVRVADAETAEAIKLFANVQRDVSFALANQFALICEGAGIDFSEVRASGAQGYPRFQLPRAGPVGGPCLTKDVHVLAASPAARGVNLDLLLAARRLNETLAPRLAAEILAALDGATGPVAIVGLGFKGAPATRDTRGSFAEALDGALRQARQELDIRFWDPLDLTSPNAALSRAAIVVLANDNPALPLLLADVDRLAPDAIIFNVAGASAGAGGVAPVRRFGEGRTAR